MSNSPADVKMEEALKDCFKKAIEFRNSALCYVPDENTPDVRVIKFFLEELDKLGYIIVPY